MEVIVIMIGEVMVVTMVIVAVRTEILKSDYCDLTLALKSYFLLFLRPSVPYNNYCFELMA